jgi:hypothetical protein
MGGNGTTFPEGNGIAWAKQKKSILLEVAALCSLEEVPSFSWVVMTSSVKGGT